MQFEVKVDLKSFQRGMSDLTRRQVPFATAMALTATARHAAAGWQQEMEQKLDRPTPFTVKSVGVRPALKSRPIARVFLRDIAAEYLEPFVDGGLHFLGKKRGLLSPKNVALNAYGNLPKSKLATLKGKPNVFIGKVALKDGGTINGVWQRQSAAVRRRSARAKAEGQKTTGALKLLIRFADPQPVSQRLDFRARTEAAVRQHFAAEFDRALAAALASAR